MGESGIPAVGNTAVGTALYCLEELISNTLVGKNWNYPEASSTDELRKLGVRLLGAEGCRQFLWKSREVLLDCDVREADFENCNYKEPHARIKSSQLIQLALSQLFQLDDQSKLHYIRVVRDGAVSGWGNPADGTRVENFQGWAEHPEQSAILAAELYQFYHEKFGRSITAVYLMLSCLFVRRFAKGPLRQIVRNAWISDIPSLPLNNGTLNRATA